MHLRLARRLLLRSSPLPPPPTPPPPPPRGGGGTTAPPHPNPLPRKAGGEGERSDLTHTNAIMGTPGYMAPEQALGETKSAGPAADIYSLGAILYDCITGRPPFKAASVLETLDQVRNQDPVPPRQLNERIPRDLETI